MPSSIKVPRVEQIEEYYCGSAVIVMILRALRVFKQPASKNEALQEEVWVEVMDLTTGPDRPEEAEGSGGWIDEFEGQQCYPCDDDWDCWATTPQALKAVLNAHLSKARAYRISRNQSEDQITVSVLKSIDAGAPVAVAIGISSHWVVAHAYMAGNAGLPSVQVGSHDLNGVYVIDPAPGTEKLDMIPVTAWMNEYAERVKCGSVLDHQRHVVVVKQG